MDQQVTSRCSHSRWLGMVQISGNVGDWMHVQPWEAEQRCLHRADQLQRHDDRHGGGRRPSCRNTASGSGTVGRPSCSAFAGSALVAGRSCSRRRRRRASGFGDCVENAGPDGARHLRAAVSEHRVGVAVVLRDAINGPARRRDKHEIANVPDEQNAHRVVERVPGPLFPTNCLFPS